MIDCTYQTILSSPSIHCSLIINIDSNALGTLNHGRYAYNINKSIKIVLNHSIVLVILTRV